LTLGSLAAKITLIAQETNSVLISIGKELRMVCHGPKVQPVTSKMQVDAQVPTIGELSTQTTMETLVLDGVLILNKIVLQLSQILSQKRKELSKFPLVLSLLLFLCLLLADWISDRTDI